MSDQVRTTLPVTAQRSPDSYVANAGFLFRKNRNTIFTALLTILVFVIVVTLNSGSFSYFDFSTMVGTGGTLALAAIGQTLVVLTGGFGGAGSPEAIRSIPKSWTDTMYGCLSRAIVF